MPPKLHLQLIIEPADVGFITFVRACGIPAMFNAAKQICMSIPGGRPLALMLSNQLLFNRPIRERVSGNHAAICSFCLFSSPKAR
jgi:hypothetical protein